MLDILYRKLVIPAYEVGLKRRKVLRYWAELERSQWLSSEELQQRQFEALRRLLTHAQETCPYFRETWREAGLRSQDMRSLEDFRAWPVTQRETINANREPMKSTQPGLKLMHKSTGGSSGEPLHFALDAGSHDRRVAAWHRGYAWAGAAPGTRQVYLWGVALGQQSAKARWKDYLYLEWLYRRHVLNCFELSDETVPRFLADYNRIRPEALVAYTNPLYAFARALEERQLTPFSPRSIVVGAEKLHDFQRELIQRVFQAPVFETYGSREFMLIGGECERHEGLHLTQEQLLVEIVDEEGVPTPAGEEGNVVVTDLYNYGMPFIRYQNGDRAIAGLKECSCGRGLPLLRRVVGRQLDVLTTPDGRQIPGEFFPHLLKDFPAIRRFQVVQEDPDEIVLKLVVDERWCQSTRETLLGLVRETVGGAVLVTIAEVDEIPLTLSGKLQVVVNRCNAESRITSP